MIIIIIERVLAIIIISEPYRVEFHLQLLHLETKSLFTARIPPYTDGHTPYEELENNPLAQSDKGWTW
jgi:hypothetical protein